MVVRQPDRVMEQRCKQCLQAPAYSLMRDLKAIHAAKQARPRL